MGNFSNVSSTMGTDRTDRKTDKTGGKWIIVRIDGKIAAVSTDYRLLAQISGHLAAQAARKPGQKVLYGDISATAADFDEIWRLRQEVQWDDLMLFGTDFQKKVWRRLWELTHDGGIPGRAGDDAKRAGDDERAREDNERTGGDDERAGEDKKAREDNERTGGEDERTGGDDKKADGDEEGRDGKDNGKVGGGNGRNREDGTRLVSYSDFAELCQNRAGVRAVAHAIGLNPVSVIIPCHLIIPKEAIDKIREIHNKAQATIFKGDDLCIGSILSGTSIDFGEYALGKEMKRELIIRELTEKSI